MTAEIPIEAQRIIDTHKFTVATAGKAFVVRDSTNKKLGRFEGPELLPLLHQAVAAKTSLAPQPAQPVLSDANTKSAKKKSYIKETDGPCFRVIFQGQPTSPTFATKGPAQTYLKQLEAGRTPEWEIPTLPGLKPANKNSITRVNATGTSGGKTVAQAVKESPKNDPNEEDPEDEDEFEAEELDDTGGTTAKSRTPTVKKTMLEWTTGKVGILILKHADKSDAELYTMCQKKGIKTKLLTIKGLRRYFRLCVQCQIVIAEEKANG